MTDSTAQTRRLFVGNISPQLAANPSDLKSRLSKFGTLKSEFTIHSNEVKQIHFGHVTIELTDKDFSKLKSSLNGLNFKGSKLIIDLAKETYQEKWTRDDLERDNDIYIRKQAKQNYEFHQKIKNINMTFKDRQELMKGRLRVAPRKEIKKMTLRVKYNGRVRILKCYKTKLWGYEKNKKLRDLVYRFTSGAWKDGNDHLVERATAIVKVKQDGKSLTIERVDEGVRDDDKLLKTIAGDDEEEREELETNNKVLASILGNFDFDKPMAIQDEQLDEFGDSDYEYQGADKSDDDDDDEDYSKLQPIEPAQYTKEGEFGKGNQKTVSFDEDDDDDAQLDLYTTNKFTTHSNHHDIEVKPKEKPTSAPVAPQLEENSDEDYEFIPTFGQIPAEPKKEEEKAKLTEGTISNTETLRSLFNANDVEESTGGFKLTIDDEEDIDHEAKVVASMEPLPDINLSLLNRTKASKGLFFPHFDSPFLIAQTQLNKLNTNVEFGSWGKDDDGDEESFWNKRGEWTREFKRRRRDVLRGLKKKGVKV